MSLTQRDIQEALKTVDDPEIKKDLVTLGMVKKVQVDGLQVNLTIQLTTPACPMKDKIKSDIEQAIAGAANKSGVPTPTVVIEFTAEVAKANQQAGDGGDPLPNVKHVIAVGAGKGGVGKSTVSSLLAISLARSGASVGLLDGDIYGPSMPTMLGLDGLPPAAEGQQLIPFDVHGIKAITIGKLVPPDKALIWRGPMAHGAFRQLALQTDWGELDYLIVDLPPGTGDVPLTLAQLIPLTGAVVVCTPQKVAQDDARRAVRMFQQLGVTVLGMVENMSYFVGDDGKQYDLFGRGGTESLAASLNIPLLGTLPIYSKLRENCDSGTPLANWDDSPTMGQQIDHMAQDLAGRISVMTHAGALRQPTISVS